MAAQVGQLGGEIAAAQAELQRLRGAQELAEQKLALAVSRLIDARDQAVAARKRVDSAAHAVVIARQKFVQFLQASYMGGDLSGTAGSLLTAQDPSAVLDRGTLEQYQADKQINAMGDLQRATVAKSNAEAAARRAVRKQAAATKAAKAAKIDADRAVADAKAQEAALESTLASKQQELQAKQLQLATLNGQRANFVAWQGRVTKYNTALTAYNNWKAEQARIAAAKAAAAQLAKERAEQRAAKRAEQRAAQRERAAIAAAAAAARAQALREHRSAAAAARAGRAAAAKARKHQHSSSHRSSGGSSRSVAVSSGAAAVERALTTLGTRYIWAGGNRYGPTDGGCSDPIASCGTKGYDCSGLVLYAWGRNWDHYAASQYGQVGSYHPRPGHFKKGDLLFWSGSGTRWGISHVAIYIGNGNVIQAPQSGERVKITPWDQVESGYYGATRPLT